MITNFKEMSYKFFFYIQNRNSTLINLSIYVYKFLSFKDLNPALTLTSHKKFVFVE